MYEGFGGLTDLPGMNLSAYKDDSEGFFKALEQKLARSNKSSVYNNYFEVLSLNNGDIP